MYKDIINNIEQFNIQIPNTIVPNPTQDDYYLGFIRRYFTQKVNDTFGHIFEIDEEIYNEYSNSPFWKCVELKWRITGPIDMIYKKEGGIEDMGVRNSNQSAIGMASTTLKNIGLYLPNILQFHK
jgi:hypothetical protein